MIISIVPIVFDLEKTIVSAAIFQLELENETKDAGKPGKDLKQTLKKNGDFIHTYHLCNGYVIVDEVLDYHFLSKKYTKLYFPRVPTPPPNQA
ncbi:hypothetical protein [Pedobacter alpinus]|uniref:Uncharacterized protein n=2 Tax=Pedobacter alpinus TaxID=1590643 RepID=A0ABW5TS66_9SPHI